VICGYQAWNINSINVQARLRERVQDFFGHFAGLACCRRDLLAAVKSDCIKRSGDFLSNGKRYAVGNANVSVAEVNQQRQHMDKRQWCDILVVSLIQPDERRQQQSVSCDCECNRWCGKRDKQRRDSDSGIELHSGGSASYQRH